MVWDYLGSIGSILIVVLVVGFCIFSHELGHFLAGKWRKLHIDAFSIGFRKIWWKKIDGIEYLAFDQDCTMMMVDRAHDRAVVQSDLPF